MKVKCIIVDDEPMARDIISSFVAKIHDLELVATCKNVSEAFTVLQNNSIQLIFPVSYTHLTLPTIYSV